jgi:uncharacterized membrane protein
MIGPLHTVLSVIALISGAIVFFSWKGTKLHKRTGYIYVISMLGCLGTSFFIFDLFGAWGPFHWMALVSLVTLSLGMMFPLFFRQKRNWLIHHYMWMSYSYVGLVMAAGSHLFAVVPSWPGWLRMLLFWGLPYTVGSLLIFRNRKAILQKVNDSKGWDLLVR